MPTTRLVVHEWLRGDPRAPLGTIETRTFPTVLTPALAADRLSSAVYDLKMNTSPLESGIIRIEVPIQQQIEALDWLRSQSHTTLPRCYFSGRDSGNIPLLQHINSNGNGHASSHDHEDPQQKLVSVAGLGSAVFFRHLRPFSLDDWRSIKRFLSKNCPLIRAYGGIRFDARSNIAPEWEGFGSFYFMVPQVVSCTQQQSTNQAEIDPLVCLQPPESPAFIGNTDLEFSSEALAATRARGGLTPFSDLQIGHDLLTSAKDDHEFVVVRESIQRKLEASEAYTFCRSQHYSLLYESYMH
ncbi:UNVERIFIED_CONTAM: Isochorismate synthase, chloroplastic [Sesamum calycinum]|uniref:Isochorismate synthase, chloroplastic n=1 Tax=Sesamum calycinum TaxID=2727403 RepID=A0AAW2JEW4_9LAMI